MVLIYTCFMLNQFIVIAGAGAGTSNVSFMNYFYLVLC